MQADTPWLKQRIAPAVLLVLLLFTVSPVAGEVSSDTALTGSELEANLAEEIKVEAVTRDEDIAERLNQIMEATGWFAGISIRVDKGVVFLDGTTSSEEYRLWAAELAGNTTDVVAVVNRVKVTAGSPWDFSPAVAEMVKIWRGLLADLPRYGLAFLFLVIVWIFIKLVNRLIRRLLQHRLNVLLQDVIIRVASVLLFLLGVYLALRLAGLSGLSATVLGGTGIAGLVAGIAFRDLLENYLASILISLRNPFQIGDLVEISPHMGVVERVTTRGTVLMNQDGNHVQIPNAIVYKSIIRNYTANPFRREMFDVGIGYDNSAAHAQKIAMQTIAEHPAVLKDPEILVLVDNLGAATVNLRIYFWYDGSAYNGLKVKSSLIRLVKQAFEQENISMPDEAREILFPEGIPVTMLQPVQATAESQGVREKSAAQPEESVTTAAEGGLASEEQQLREQARTSRNPEEGESLLSG